ncbi:MAG TPA: homocitrate synthase [Bacillota bacterium]|nr:homocitrate synthase [Bacillota bacterium]
MYEKYTFEYLESQPYFDKEKIWGSPLNYIPVYGQPIKESVYIHDVTLRDGEQTPGVIFSLEERLEIGKALSELGVARIEAGMPVVSEQVAESIKKLVNMKLDAEIATFCRAHIDDIEASLRCGVRSVIVEHTVNPYLCKYAYGLSEEALMDRLISCVARAKAEGLNTTFMGWDFFRSPIEFTKKVYSTVVKETNPDGIVLVDTFGVATPLTVYHVFREFREMFPDTKLEFHCHNEFGWATGAAISAIAAGADGVHSAINGLGERTGNLSTEETAVALEVLFGVSCGVKLEKIAEVSKLVSEASGVPIATNKPVLGERLFWAESGVVTDVFTKLAQLGVKPAMTPYVPELVGRGPTEYVIGKGSGGATIRFYLDKHGIAYTDGHVSNIVSAVKSLAYEKKGLVSEEELLEIARREIEG